MTKKPKTPKKQIVARWGFKRLSDQRVDPTLGPADAEPGEQEGDAVPTPSRRPRKPRGSATDIVVGAALEAATTVAVRRRLARGQALAVVVIVPGPAWVAPVAAYVKSEFGSRWCFHTRDGTDRKRDDAGSVEAARDLSRGFCVMGVAYDEKLLPASLQSAADIVIHIASPDGTVVRRAITRFVRRSPGELDPQIAAGLDLPEIVAAFRPDQGAKDVVRRLEAARRSHTGSSERVPVLATAVEYGEAQRWGLDLARDIADFRNGKIAWRDVDRGICLHSPPGFGKSWFARVLAQGCGVPLVSTSAGSWFANGPGFLDSVVKECRKSHALAVAMAAPVSIWHIDEVDAAVPERANMSDRAQEWWNVLVSDILNIVDSALAARDAKLVVIGSCNNINRVDSALLRPGRLEKVVALDPPDAAGITNILAFHLQGELAGEDLAEVGAVMEGSTPAEVMHMVRTARRAARYAGRGLAIADLVYAAMPHETHPPARLFRMAIHESAHAVILLALAAGTVRHVSLASTGDAGGRTSVLYADDDLATRKAIEDRATVGLAARAAERLFTGSVSTGAGGAADSDLGAVTIMVASLHASFGMRGAPIYLGAGEELLRAVALDAGLREAVTHDLCRLERRADRLVAANRDAILAVAARLAEKRRLDGAEVEALVRGRLRGRRRRRPAGEG
ncbi:MULTISPECIES: AAA family ATPase [Bradyrhizobium]|uniref:Cell division protease FtsH n=1 Tax=Bradyrhizobium ottawaense TaxID=931866 RepID=A0ABV4FQ27_9BRAD|nr:MULTISPECIES: AAA family ATPase [Bradyrhizobium]WLB45997.1 AAA family ATPase [Bradyrhizobium ottawaense]WQN83279.1 AAA family ATPase [Bradyrhizobium ottawaense]